MKRKPNILFDDFGNPGNLCISWYPGPHGEAVDDLNEVGVGFFGPNGELLSVEFDNIDIEKDHQFLEFPNLRVETITHKGKVTVKVHSKKRLGKKAA